MAQYGDRGGGRGGRGGRGRRGNRGGEVRGDISPVLGYYLISLVFERLVSDS